MRAAAWAPARRGSACAHASANRPCSSQQRLGQLDHACTQPFAEALGLGILAGRGGDTFLQQPVDHEVERADAGQPVAIDAQRLRLGQQLLQLLGGEVRVEPGPRRVAAREDAEIRVAALVARACAVEVAQGRAPGGAGGCIDGGAGVRGDGRDVRPRGSPRTPRWSHRRASPPPGARSRPAPSRAGTHRRVGRARALRRRSCSRGSRPARARSSRSRPLGPPSARPDP